MEAARKGRRSSRCLLQEGTVALVRYAFTPFRRTSPQKIRVIRSTESTTAWPVETLCHLPGGSVTNRNRQTDDTTPSVCDLPPIYVPVSNAPQTTLCDHAYGDILK